MKDRQKLIRTVVPIALCCVVVAVAILSGTRSRATMAENPARPAAPENTVSVTQVTETRYIIDDPKTPHPVEVDYQPIIFSECQRESRLIVMTRKATVTQELKKNGILNLSIFAQSQVAIFRGQGVYTVDLGQIEESDIAVSKYLKTITITLPQPELSVEYLPEETEFFDTTNGLFAFGELKLSADERTAVEVLAKDLIAQDLNADPEAMRTAREYAALSVESIFNPIVKAAMDAAVAEANDEYAVPVYYTVIVRFRQ